MTPNFKAVLNSSGDLPYLETTLPQERPGTVTITPSNRRISGKLSFESEYLGLN